MSPGLSSYCGSSDLYSHLATQGCAKPLRNNDCVIQEPWLKGIQGLCSKCSLKPLSWEEMLTAACFTWLWTSFSHVLSLVCASFPLLCGRCWLLSPRGDIPVSPLLGTPRAGRWGKRGQRSQGEGWGLQELGGIPRQEETTEAVRCFHPPEFANKVVATELISVTLPCHLNLILDV